MRYAPGMEAALRMGEVFADDDEAAAYWAEGAIQVRTEDTTYTGAAGQTQAARLYRGDGGPAVLYIHGGGWVGGSIALNERACRHLAAAGADVVSISYRLAPAHPYPAGLEDCRSALSTFRDRLGRTDFVLSGASAGANLALALALGDRDLAGLILFYGLFGDDLDTESYREHGTNPGLLKSRVAEILELYDPEGHRATDAQLLPARATPELLAHLPRTLLLAAEIDVLRDDSILMAKRLHDAGVATTLHVEPGVTHGFINRGRLVPAADAALDRAAEFLINRTAS